MPDNVWPRSLIAMLILCLETGCQWNAPDPHEASGKPTTAHKQSERAAIPQQQETIPMEVFARHKFYRQREEPEELLVGVLRAVPVRTGPNTREMPFKLIMGKDEYGVYVSGFDQERLRPYVGHQVEILGKRIDQREEGYGIEVWMATIRMH